MLDHRPQRQSREILKQVEDDDHADQKPDEERAVGREGSGRSRDLLLRRQRPGKSEHRNDVSEAAKQHRYAERRVEPERIAAEARKCRAVIRAGGREGVENF